MRNSTKYILLNLAFLFFSCQKKEANYIFEERLNLDLHTVKMNEVVSFENNLHSIERKKDTAFNIGTFHYTNAKSLTHKIFQRKDSKLFLDSDYYYTKKDSLLKVVLYDWYLSENPDRYVAKSKNEEEVENKLIKNKYEDLKKSISLKLDKANFHKSFPFENMTVWENDKKNYL